MHIYFLLWFFIVVSNFVSNYKPYLNKVVYFIFMVVLTIFVGFRYKIGGDWSAYNEIYDSYKYLSFFESLFFIDPGYSLINMLGSFLKINEIWFVNFISAAIIFIFLYKAFDKLGKYWLCLLIYFPYHILVVSLGYTRQSIAVAILLYAFFMLFENKNSKFIFFVIIASIFHKTAIIFLLFYPILLLIKKGKILYIYQILSIFIISYVLYLSSLSEGSIYTSGSEGLSSSGVFMRLSMHVIPLSFYFLLRNKLFKIKNYYLFLDYFVLLIFYCLVLAFFFSTLADRFNLYLIFFDLYVLISVYMSLKDINNKNIFILVLTLFYTAFIVLWLLTSDFVKIAWIPYQNYIWNYLINDIF